MEASELAALIQGPIHPLSLYVHLPFCRSRCPYCDFFSVAGAARSLVEQVVLQTSEELGFFAGLLEPLRPASVYVGGGTPSMVPLRLLEDLFCRIRTLLQDGGEGVEWSVEANPESLTADFLQTCRRSGLNRLSVGIQTLRAELLERLGRPGTAADNRRALDLAAGAWGRRWSVDLLAGIPGQSRAQLLEDIRRIQEYGPGHISLYCLTPPEGSPLKVNPERADVLWLAGRELLEGSGYRQYEISNFCRPGEECRHNLRAWRLEPYLGVGPAAVGTLPGAETQGPPGGAMGGEAASGGARPAAQAHPQGGEPEADPLAGRPVVRLTHPGSIHRYLGGRERAWGLAVELIGRREFLLENLIMGLRLRSGLDRRRLAARFGLPLSEMVPELWRRWRRQGLVREAPGCDALSDRGRLLLDRLLLEAGEELERVSLPAGRTPGG